MKLEQARRLRDFLRENNIPCTVPTKKGQQEYYVKCTHGIQKQFNSIEEYNAYVRDESRRLQEFIAKNSPPPDRRSPIERMVDEACGYKQ